MTSRDSKRLDGVHPKLASAYIRINEAMGALGFPIFVVEGVRTAERQQELYAQGRTKPGNIVTYLDGVEKKGKHQQKGDGFGYAIDFAFIDDPRTPKDETWDEKMPWILVGVMAEHLGLTWGGRWTRPVDSGHIELPGGA